MSKKDTGLKLGISRYTLSTSIKTDSKNKDINYGKYPNGLFPFIFLLVVWAVISVIAIFVSQRNWKDALSISSSITFILNIVWWILRQNFNSRTRYSLRVYGEKLRINRLKITEPFNNPEYAINKIDDHESYKEYLNERVKRTSLFFWISLAVHFVLFIIFLIIVLVNYL
ncbi:MAG: hypothetical protein RSA87_01370 [Malacoplasma sp.]